MSKKIEIIGSALMITDTVSGIIETSQPKTEVWYNEPKLQNDRIKIESIRFLSESTENDLYPEFDLADAVDSSLVAFTQSSFRTFCHSNLGSQSEAAINIALERAQGNISGESTFDKFGKITGIDIGDAPQDLWNGGGDYTGFSTGAAETMQIRSNNSNDTAAGTGARTIKIYNLLDSTGAEMPDVTVTLNGTSWVSLGSQTYYRGGTRIEVLTSGSTGSNEGNITLRHTTTTSNIFAVLPIGLNQTAVGVYTVPLGKTLYLNRINIQMSRANGAAGSASVTFRNRPNGGVFNPNMSPEITNSQSYTFENNGFIKLEERTDVKARCESVSDNNTSISCDFNGVLIDN